MKKQILVFLLAAIMVPLAALARNYDVSFKNVTPQAAIEQLMDITKCDFVYQKELLNNSKQTINGIYKNMPLNELLDNIIIRQLGLSYRIVNNTVVISKGEKATDGSDVRVHGLVSDESGDPLPGVSVKIEGKPIAAATDAKGEFTLKA